MRDLIKDTLPMHYEVRKERRRRKKAQRPVRFDPNNLLSVCSQVLYCYATTIDQGTGVS